MKAVITVKYLVLQIELNSMPIYYFFQIKVNSMSKNKVQRRFLSLDLRKSFYLITDSIINKLNHRDNIKLLRNKLKYGKEFQSEIHLKHVFFTFFVRLHAQKRFFINHSINFQLMNMKLD